MTVPETCRDLEQKIKRLEFELAESAEQNRRLRVETADFTLLHNISRILLNSEPEEQLFAEILDVILAAFDSSLGFLGYLNEEGDFVSPSMTRSVWERCQVPEKGSPFHQDSWKGLWGRLLLTRRPLLANGGLHPPDGHIALHRAMAAPLFVNDTLVGQLAIANKEGDYSEDDLQRLTRLAEYIAPTLHDRKLRKAEERNREKAEAALRHRQVVLQTLIDGVTESVFLMDSDGYVLALNDTVAARLGKTRNDLLGKNIYHYVPGEVAARRRNYVEQVIASRSPVFFEDERMDRTILNTVYPIFDEDGEVFQFAIVGYDLTERKRIERELQRHKALLEQTQKIAHLGGWEYDTASKKVAWSREVYDIYGVDESYDPSDIGRDISYYAVEHQPVIARAFSLAIEKGEPYDVDLRFRRHDGRPLWVRTAAAPVLENGKVVKVYGNIIDISERKAAEEELSRQRNFVRQIFDSSDDSMAVIDSEGYILDVNAVWRRFARNNGGGDPISWDVGASYFRPCIDSLDATNAQAAYDGVRAVQSGKRTSFEIEYPCHSPDERRWFVMRVLMVIGQTGNVLVAHHNITERKLAEESLAQQNEKLLELNDIILRSSSVAIVWHLTPGQWSIEIVSGNIEKLTGYTAEEFYDGRAEWTRITHPDDLRRLEHEVQTFLGEGKNGWLQEYRIIKKDQTIRWCQDDNRVLYDHQGKPTRIQAIIHDITEQKRVAQAAAELDERNRQILKAESLNCMAGAIAHNYNNLLSAIIGNIEMAEEFLEGHSQAASFLRQAQAAAGRAADVSRKMLTYLGINHERLVPLDLGELCRREVDALRLTLPQGVALEARFPLSGPFLVGHASHLAHALRQLIRNAEEAMEGTGGNIGVTVSTLAAARIPGKNRFPLEWQPKGVEYAELAVTDSGCGIDSGDIDKVFDPFFTSKFTGRGLGLPVVLGIVKVHKGAVVVTSEKGRGSAFRLFFPLGEQCV